MPVIDIPDQGIEVEFPDTMSDGEILDVLRRKFPKPTPESLQPVTAIPRPTAAPIPPQEQQRQAAFGIEPAPELKDLTFDEFKQLAGEMLTTGLITTPKFTIKPQDSFLVSAGKSVFNEIASVPEFMSSPLGAGTMAAGGAGMVKIGKAVIPASRIVATAFAADTYYNLRKNLMETMPHLAEMSESELGEFVGRTAASGLLLGGLIRGAVGKAGTLAKPEAPTDQAAKQAEAAGLPATAEALREQPTAEVVAEPTALTPQTIGPGVSPIPEPVFGPTATPARGEGGGPPPTRVESGAPVEAATPVVTGPPAEGPAGPAIRPTTTEVAPSQAEAKPAAPAAEPGGPSAGEIERPVGMVGRPRTGVAPQVAEGGPAEVQPAPGAERATLQGGERASVVAGGAQGEVRGEVGKATRGPWFLRPRSDGIPDVLDAIQDLGGIKPPSEVFKPGGEYDGWSESMRGSARLLIRKSAKHAPDTMMQELQSYGYRFETPDQMYLAIQAAVREREALRQRGGSQEEQTDKFWNAAVTPGSKIGLVKIQVDDLTVGQKFRLKIEGASHEEFEVVDISADGVVTVKDGPKFRAQELPEGSEIWVKKGTLAEAPKGKTQPGQLFPEEEMQFNLAGEKLTGVAERPAEQTTGFGTETLAQQEMFAISKVVKSIDPAKSADAAEAMYGGPVNAIETIEKQLRVVDSDPKTKRDFTREQRDRLKEVLALLRQRAAKTTKPAEPAPAEPMIGMGAAVPAEFERGQGSPTAMKFRKIDEERQKRGLAPLVKPESVSDQAVLDKAIAALDRDPSLPDQLVAELNQKPRPIEAWENHVLLLRKIELRQELDRAARDSAQAYSDGRVDDMEAAKTRWDFWSNRLTQLEQASRVAGTERGRALRALQVMVNEDFSLAEMETRLRMAKGGSPLTDVERVKLVQIADEYKAAAEKAEERAKTAEQRFLEQETARVLAEAKLRTLETEAPKYPPPVIRAAERIVSSMERTADRYMKELMGATWAPGPEQMAKLAFISATRLARLGLDFTKWSAEMVKDFGDKIKPYLDDLYKRGQALLDQHLEEQTKPMAQPVREKVKKAVKKEGYQDAVQDLTDKIRAKVEKDELAQITPLVQKLARELVAAGTTEREALIDQLHAILKTVIPDITRRQTMEAMSGYGDFKPLTKDDVSVQLRDIKGQTQQVLKLEDIQARQPIPKTGIERRVPSNEERRLIKQVNEAKKKYGVVVTDPARQLKSALDARKTAMRNRIADLNYEIETRQRIVKTKTAPPTDAELEALIAERDRLRVEHDAIFKKPGLTDSQRLQLAIAAAKRSETYWQQKLTNAKQGRFGPIQKLRETLGSPELDAVRARTEAIRAEVDELEALANPKATPEQVSLKALKSRMATEEAKLRDRMASGDFSKRKPKPVPLDQEAITQRARLQRLRNEFAHMQFQAEQALRSRARRGLDAALNTIDAARAVKTSFDLSAVLRQGGLFVSGHPIRAIRSFGAMLRAIRSERGMLEVNEEIMERPNFKSGLYHQSKLYLADQFGRLGSMEEAYMSHWAHRIPGVAASERAYITFLNRLRADMFDLIYDSVRNPDLSAVEKGRIVANLVNAFTGRGELRQNAAVGLNRLFFSPRFVISRFQVITGEPILRGKGARMVIAKEYARSLAGIAAVYTLAHMAGLQVGFNPFSSDFGKIIIGDTRVDPLAGLSQAFVFMARVGFGTMTSIRGKTKPLRGPGMKYGDTDMGKVIWNFIRSKLAPTPGGTVDLATRKEAVTERPLTKTEIALNWIMPMSFDDMYSVMRVHNMPTGMALSLLLMLGMGVRNYGSEPSEIAFGLRV